MYMLILLISIPNTGYVHVYENITFTFDLCVRNSVFYDHMPQGLYTFSTTIEAGPMVLSSVRCMIKRSQVK